MRHATVPTLILALAALAAPALAQISYLPQAPGCAWTYTDGAGHERTVAAVGPAVIQGEDVQELVWTEPDQVYHNFWSLDAEGAVYLHGAFNEDGFVASYSPPILALPAVTATQRCWSTATRIYWSLDGSEPWGVATITYCIVGGGVTTVPAGDFETVTVEASLPPFAADPDRPAHDALGRRRDGGARVPAACSYAAGVGLVKEGAWELTTYGGPTPHEAAGWGEIKALFR